ncbi:MAG: hypothetical protein M0017_01885 [Desulfobacteraceae bacterium]|nr:hypothetical protein [Desulfobacteraceae bacterium]
MGIPDPGPAAGIGIPLDKVGRNDGNVPMVDQAVRRPEHEEALVRECLRLFGGNLSPPAAFGVAHRLAEKIVHLIGYPDVLPRLCIRPVSDVRYVQEPSDFPNIEIACGNRLLLPAGRSNGLRQRFSIQPVSKVDRLLIGDFAIVLPRDAHIALLLAVLYMQLAPGSSRQQPASLLSLYRWALFHLTLLSLLTHDSVSRSYRTKRFLFLTGNIQQLYVFMTFNAR